MDENIYYNVISDIPKHAGEHIVEILASCDIEVIEIVKEINANIK